MPLTSVPLSLVPRPMPGEVRRFLREAEERIERFRRARRVARFVPSDFAAVWAALCALEEVGQPLGSFCEWGSGLGVVACLAAMLDFDAVGIEIDPDLVEAAQELADDFEVSVTFACGSFIPDEAPDAYEPLGLAPDDFDVIYAYPWPDEQRDLAEVFERHARDGALLMTYQGNEEVGLRRKTGPRRKDGLS